MELPRVGNTVVNHPSVRQSDLEEREGSFRAAFSKVRRFFVLWPLALSGGRSVTLCGAIHLPTSIRLLRRWQSPILLCGGAKSGRQLLKRGRLVQAQSVIVTPSGNGKSVTVSNCHSKQLPIFP